MYWRRARAAAILARSRGGVMTAALTGIGLGALHAVSGPDHVLSLAPRSVEGGARAGWRLGASWGAGHAAGTALWFLAALLAGDLLGRADPALLDRVAGVALAGTGALGLWRARRPAAARGGGRGAFLVGALHGLTGAASVLLLLPAIGAEGAARFLWLAGFAAGSTAAMAALTALLARAAGAALPALRHLAPAASALSIAVGAAWALA
jgi:hypothetical protein